MILYLHGFRSSPHSTKARQLAEYLASNEAGVRFRCPQLPVSPFGAIALAEELIRTADHPVTLIGSSLGGYYATWLTECHWQRIHRVVLVNPMVDAGMAEQFIGTHHHYHGNGAFDFTRRHAAEIRAIEVPLVRHLERYWLMVETGDEVLDYRLAIAKYLGARQTVIEGGNHSFTRWTGYLDEIAALDATL